MADPTHPLSQGQKTAVLIGAVALVVGIGLLLWGLAPAKGFSAAGGAFGGGQPPDDLNEQIDAALDGVMARAWASGLGLAGILGGVIAVKEGSTRKPFTVEERVQQELAKRQVDPVDQVLDDLQAAPAASVAAPPSPPLQAEPEPPAPAAAPGSSCPTCGEALIAGGKFCRTCGRV